MKPVTHHPITPSLRPSIGLLHGGAAEFISLFTIHNSPFARSEAGFDNRPGWLMV
jgi:hypothetical protein